jgi:hypothetical protein
VGKMLRIIEKETDVRKAQDQLEKRLKSILDKHGRIMIGGKGWHQFRETYWNRDLGFWWTAKDEEDRFWNSFGLQEPQWGKKYPHSIVVEVNLPKNLNRRISGAVVGDEMEGLFLLHRGIIGGGRKGIGKSLFVNNFIGEWVSVREGNNIARLALVASLGSKEFPQQMSVFVHEVARIKYIAPLHQKSDLHIPDRTFDAFREEFTGIKRYSSNSEIEAKCNHGIIVKGLEEKLISEGSKVGNRYGMDLYILGEKNEVKTLYEVKTDTERQSCYAAIGQLFFNSIRLGINPQLVAVFPDVLGKNFRGVLAELGIKVLTFRLINGHPYFSC